ncbi:DUF4164 family protein [Insolitispirillum peregrinum]|uniref:Uncharacterized protein n=1 Tax=Insolitispirillum peregrinum TaxID=80876 RepID=A0A1N7IXW0_9PROT|nr:DUF4164 family protein [Insolitispirillum peregrinum]SIS41884.1 protein of unknown function [Insolitispirillum peregrinum]
MTRIEQALQRLGKAVSRLEAVGQDRISASAEDAADAAAIAHLSAELAAMRSNYESLQLTSQQASGRIDAAIGRLRAVLES